MKPPAALVLVLLLVLAVAACGGGDDSLSPDAYRSAIRTSWEQVGSNILKGSQAVARAPSGEHARRRLVSLQESVRNGAEEIDGLRPPADAADPQDRVVRALRDLARSIDEFVAQAQVKGLRPLASFDNDLRALPAYQRLVTALQDLGRAGYRVEG